MCSIVKWISNSLGLTESYVVFNAKIKAALGINSLPLSAEEGLSITIKSFHSKK